MGYFPVDDQAAFHHKIVAAGNAAIGCWTRAGSWSKANATGGFIPDSIATALGTRAERKRLVEVGLWEAVLGGYTFHDWTDHGSNRDSATEEQLKKRRDDDRRRAKEKRDREKAEREAEQQASSRDASRDDYVTEPASSRDASRDDHVKHAAPSRDVLPRGRVSAHAHGFTRAHDQSQSQSHLGTDLEISPVPETAPSYPQADCEQWSENDFIDAAARRQVDFRKVRARLTAQAGGAVPAPVVWLIIRTVLDRANSRDGDRTGVVVHSVKHDWAEHSQIVYAAGVEVSA